MNPTCSPSDLPGLEGTEFEPSDWLEITQQRIDDFADATNDHQFIHVDPERAANGPFGGTIAHGFLTLSLVPWFLQNAGLQIEGTETVVNYGSNRIRFLAPVPVGSRIRARQKLKFAEEKRPGCWLITTRVTIDIEDQTKPAMIAEFLAMYIVK